MSQREKRTSVIFHIALPNLDRFSKLFRSSIQCLFPYKTVILFPATLQVRVKFGDSTSNRSRDIRVPHFVTNALADGPFDCLQRFALTIPIVKII